MNPKARQHRVRCLLRVLVVAVSIAWLGGCGAPGPFVSDQQSDRSSGTRPPPAPEAYRVSRGDTLYSIAFRYGLDWRDVARWNGIDAPYTIHAGGWIRLQPRPDMRAAVVAAESPSTSDSQARSGAAEDAGSETSANPDSRPDSDSQVASTEADASDQAAPASAAEEQQRPVPIPEPDPTPGAASVEDETPPPSAPKRSVAGVTWRWPTSGEVERAFDAGAARKGILIAGESGQSIRAAAPGQVVYSGNGLIGYGELIIIKHSERMLSAYAHNRERLVAEGDRVAPGDLIARMGINERAENVLHFEIRRDGKPANPMDYLPRR